MAKQKWKGGALVAPVPPAMISCGSEEDGNANIITIAWTGIINTIPPKTYISVRPSRHSYGIIKNSGEFAINLTTTALVRSADYCGVYTGAKVDKFEKCGFTKELADTVGAPRIAECPVALECRVTERVPLGSHDMFLAEILSVAVDEELFDDKGKIHMEKADLLAYVHGEYFTLGRKIGAFGFSAVKKKKKGPPSHGTKKA